MWNNQNIDMIYLNLQKDKEFLALYREEINW